MRVCLDCPRLTNSTRCERCRKAKRRKEDRRRPSAAKRGYDQRWQRTRRQFLARFPICQHPDGCLTPSTDVHHLDGLGPKGPRGHDWENLQALCHAHHSSVTAQEHGWSTH